MKTNNRQHQLKRRHKRKRLGFDYRKAALILNPELLQKLGKRNEHK